MSMPDEMHVTKRDGKVEIVSFDKILRRIKAVGAEADIKINYTVLAMKVIDQLYDKISTTKIDELTAEQCASMSSIHYDYGTLASRVAVSNHHKNTDPHFPNVVARLYHFIDKGGKQSPLVSDELYQVVQDNADLLQNALDFNRDYLFDYFGFKTLEKSYLMRINGIIVERPQHMWMRVALGIHGTNVEKAIETYHMMSQKYFTHATPTLFNSGTPRPQMSSCYLISMQSDSIDGIFDTLKDCALISKWAGGIGLHIHNVRATNSHIRGTNGTSNGIVPMLRVFNNTAKYVDQCLHPDTIVYCKDGPKPIKNIVIGDEVINDDGMFRPICKILDYPDYQGPLYHIGLSNGTVIRATDMHPFWIVNNGWTDAKDIEVGYQMGYPVPKYECDYVNVSIDDCKAYGLLFGSADKNVCYYNGSNKEFLRIYLSKQSIEIREYEDTLEFIIPHGHILNAYNLTHLWPAMLHMPKEKTQALLDSAIANVALTHIVPYLQLRLHCDKTIKVTSVSMEHNYNGRVLDIEVGDSDHHNFLTHGGLVHNGGGRRHGSFAIYLEPWHADIEKFLEMRKNHGDEELKARDLFYALWIPDLFMERVKADGTWTLMCPDECPGLSDVYGQAFVDLYTKYESEGKGRSTVKARELWFKVLDAQMETGTPYLCYKDAANEKSNQKNIGTIKSSNLCTEITEVSTPNETAVCNLASIGLPMFVSTDKTFDYDKLREVAKIVTNNLNNVIDVNYYPTPKTKVSNMKHRPIGIGVQGLADVFMMMDIPFHSEEARDINKRIFENIYYGALQMSMEIAKRDGPYETFAGSPASEGLLQFDLWITKDNEIKNEEGGIIRERSSLNWPQLKADIQKYGLRNSLLVAPMPTASTSQILGFNECFEPFTSNIYSRRTLAGEFVLTNKYLMKELIDMGLWNTELKNNIIANQGSIQHIGTLPEHMRNKYKTVWEIPMRHIIDMAADRGQYICQSQSMNLWQEDPTYASLTSMHFYAWQKGLKTGIYYLRRRAKHRAQQFTIEPKKEEECVMCSA